MLKAYDSELRRLVAIKILHEGRTDRKARERFVREAQAAAGLKHDHIVGVHAVANPGDGPPYMVMEYVPGPSLHQHIKAEGSIIRKKPPEFVVKRPTGSPRRIARTSFTATSSRPTSSSTRSTTGRRSWTLAWFASRIARAVRLKRAPFPARRSI